MAAGGQRSKIDQIWPHKSHFGSAFGSRSSNLDKIWHEHSTWPLKQACARTFHLSQNPRWPPGVKGPKSTKFDTTNHILARHLDLACQIWTKFCMDILLDLKNKSAQEFFIYRKIQDGRRGSKIQNWPRQIWPHNDISALHLDLVHQIWKKIGMNILLDPTNKFAQEFIS